MKYKMAVEMEFDVPDVHAKKFEGRIDEFCEDLAKTVADETASSMATVGIGVKYEGCSWIKEHEKGYADGVLYFGE